MNKVYSMGIKNLDQFIKPIKKNFVVISSKPGVGKSSFILQQALANAELGTHSLFISLEVNKSKVYERIMTWYKGYFVKINDYEKIEKEERFENIMNHISIACPSCDGNDILWSIDKEIKTHDIGIIYVDCLDIIYFNGCSVLESFKNIVSELKQIGVENDILVVGTTQTSSNPEDYHFKVMPLSKVTSMEQYFDIVIYLENIKNNFREGKKTINVKIAKNTNKLINEIIQVNMQLKSMKFVSVEN